MKKTIAILLVLAFVLQACAVIQFTENGQEVKAQKRIFYVVYGLAPITDNAVKVGPAYTTKQDFIDGVITAFTGGIIYSHSVFPK